MTEPTCPGQSRISLTLEEISAVVEQSYDGILVIDGHADVVLVNDSYFRITGLDRRQVEGKNFREFADNSPYKKTACIEALDTKRHVTRTHTNLIPGKVVMVTAKPILDEQGQVRLVIGNCRDMSEMVLLREQLERAQELEELYYKRLEGAQISGPVTVSRRINCVFQAALKVSSVDITVLITGESGVGKEVLARYIHEHGARKEAPFVAVNCGAIPDTLLESEFFGYVGGAFTGALKHGKKGLFETADGGTLFLDEIGDLPFALQVKLLRVLDTGEITRVGDSVPTPVNVRIVAATNKDLAKMVADNKFREDLYYRLNVIHFHIPPLRERPEDIRPLCMYFLHESNRRYGQNKRLSPELQKFMENYSWPGNIRQLKHMVERMVVLGDEDPMTILPPVQDMDIAHYRSDGASHTISVSRSSTIPQAVAAVEKQLLAQALTLHSSSRQIARVTGVDQTTVLRKIRKYGLKPQSDGVK
ncbi:MAG TPA: sigma 54-interacting transcriptional regulator [Patescibacteria group bacterium]|nr:sigma 54-interacting transcriptional regulator [Patescibacteria group bacterium]